MQLFPQTGLRLTSHSRPPSWLRLLGGEQGAQTQNLLLLITQLVGN